MRDNGSVGDAKDPKGYQWRPPKLSWTQVLYNEGVRETQAVEELEDMRDEVNGRENVGIGK